ncbi:MAG: nucleotidyl transferase AbiEii/AbiGii toxin family protein [Planctomycetaceae bacterium]
MPAERDPPVDPLVSALDDVVAVIVRAGVDYALIGGLATGFRSRPRYTNDIDLLIDVPSIVLPAVLARLGERGFDFDTPKVIEEFTRHHMTVLWRDGIRLDLLKPVLPAYRHVLERATTEQGPNGPIRVATAEGMILLKLFAFRLQDQTDVESLVAANRDALDLEWIRQEWRTVFELDDPRMQWLLGLVAAG